MTNENQTRVYIIYIHIYICHTFTISLLIIYGKKQKNQIKTQSHKYPQARRKIQT